MIIEKDGMIYCFHGGASAGKTLIKLIDKISEFDKSLERVEQIAESVPNALELLEIAGAEQTPKKPPGRHKKKGKTYKNWEHKEYWRR